MRRKESKAKPIHWTILSQFYFLRCKICELIRNQNFFSIILLSKRLNNVRLCGYKSIFFLSNEAPILCTSKSFFFNNNPWWRAKLNWVCRVFVRSKLIWNKLFMIGSTSRFANLVVGHSFLRQQLVLWRQLGLPRVLLLWHEYFLLLMIQRTYLH